MTDIQIKYWSYVEGARHNYATEEQQRNELSELRRHSLITEGQGQQSINETIRHNLVGESQGQQSINEHIRHNYATEDIGYINANASMLSASAALQNAAANTRNAATNAMVGKTTARLNTQNAIGKHIDNTIKGAGVNIKATASIFDAVLQPASTTIDMGTKLTNSFSSLVKVLN